MNTKKFTLKNILLSCTALLLLFLTSFGIVLIKKPVNTVNAAEPVVQTLTNANFNDDKNTSYPFKPSGFDAYIGDEKIDSSTKANVDAGVIDLTSSKYNADLFPNATIGIPDNKVLMIDSLGNNTNYGFRTSSDNLIKIKANSYYIITVYVYTATDANISNIFLYKNNDLFSSFTNINTEQGWNHYHFFISTNDMDEYNLSLGLYQIGTGITLFDNIRVEQVNAIDYKKEIALYENKKEIKSDNYIVNSYKIQNGEYVNVSNGLDKTSLDVEEDIETASYSTISSSVENSDGTNLNAYHVAHSDKTYTKLYTKEDFITFEQSSVYKVSVNLKAENLSGKATLQLIRTNAEEDDDSAIDSKVIEITSSTPSNDNKLTNGYNTYSFYVYSDPTKSTSYQLVISLGDKDNLTSGNLYINSLNISKITYEIYNSASDSYKLDLVKYHALSNTTSDDIAMLDNGEFNAFEISDLKNPMPAEPTNWSVMAGNNTQYYGVVNSNTTLDNEKYTNPHIPSSDNNNMLMLYNASGDVLSYTSNTKTLQANSYHKFQISINAQHADAKISLVTTKDETEIELTSLTVASTEFLSLDVFKEVTLYILTGSHSVDVALKITLDTTSSNGYGYIYADTAKFDNILAPTETEFNNAVVGTLLNKVDLNNLLASNNDKPYYFSSTGNIDALKVVNTANQASVNQFVSSNYEAFTTGIPTGDVIALRSASNTTFTLTSSLGFGVKADKYYKLTVYVFTQNIGTNQEDVDASNLGAGVKVSGYDNSFTAINTNCSWTPYTFFIDPDTDKTIYIELSLGNTNYSAKGDAFFGNITLEDISADMDENKFSNIVEKSDSKVLKTTTKNNDNTENETTTEEKEKAPINKSLILYLFAGLTTAVAIIIAVVGIAIRKIKWKKPVKKSKNEYDRNKTVSKQVYTRKATTMRENKLIELKKDLEKVTTERAQFEEQYKKDLSKLRELKIKRADANEIAKFEKEMKKNQRLSASLGVTMNKIQAEIEYAKTDAYLNALMKKLARESTIVSNEEKESK